jgi:hypothetical protein
MECSERALFDAARVTTQRTDGGFYSLSTYAELGPLPLYNPYI